MIITTQDQAVREILQSREEGKKILPFQSKPAWKPLRPIDIKEYRNNYIKNHPLGDKAFFKVLPDNSWKDEACFIVAGGPSLMGFDFNRLKGAGRIIAINKAYLNVPFADILLFMDISFYHVAIQNRLGEGSREAFEKFKGHRVFLDIQHKMPLLTYSIHSAGRWGFPSSMEEGLYHGNNTGYVALQLAYVLGCNPIYLLGYDASQINGKSHYHDGYPHMRQSPQVSASFAKGIEDLAPGLKKAGRRVINLNPNSAIKCFEFKTPDEVLG